MAPWRRRIAKFANWQASKIMFATFFLNNIDYQKVNLDYSDYLGTDWKQTFQGASTVVSNHTSFVDIVVQMYLQEASHVAKAGIRNIPFVGTIASGVGCLFVDRDSKE